MSDALVRVTAKQKRAVEALFAAGRPTAEDTCLAVLTAEDSTTRYCVVTVDAHRNYACYGPYATSDAAYKAIDTGVLANSADVRGGVFPLIAAPKKERK